MRRRTELNIDLKGLTGPGLAIDGAGNMYVSSSQSGTVAVFAPGATKPSRTISNLSAYGISTVSAGGALYVPSQAGTVAEGRPGAKAPSNTITGPSGSLLLGAPLSP